MEVGQSSQVSQSEAALKGFREVLAAYSQIIVLLADDKSVAEKDRSVVNADGQNLFF